MALRRLLDQFEAATVPDTAYQPTPPGWGMAADLLWLIVLVALVWLLAPTVARPAPTAARSG